MRRQVYNARKHRIPSKILRKRRVLANLSYSTVTNDDTLDGLHTIFTRLPSRHIRWVQNRGCGSSTSNFKRERKKARPRIMVMTMTMGVDDDDADDDVSLC
jgi:hypothetical protein